MRRYLIVANQTLGGEQLVSKIAESMNAGPCRFYLVAPVTQTEASDRWASGGLDGGVLPGAYKLASREEVDEIIVSTLPRRLSRWMAMDLPHRVRRATKLPVTHITGPAGPSL